MSSDADLHGLVDGSLEPSRRADVLRRAAASPRDRALIEDWQDQNDAIRIAFADVEREPLPAALDLRLMEPLEGQVATPALGRRSGRQLAGGVLVGLATCLIVAGLIAPRVIGGLDPSRLADLAWPASRAISDGAIAALPTTTIPDLSAAGFAFTGAAPRVDGSEGLVFHYRAGAGERVAIDAERPGVARRAAFADRGGLAWTEGRVAYTISGTLPPDRLRALAMMLRSRPSKGDAAD